MLWICLTDVLKSTLYHRIGSGRRYVHFAAIVKIRLNKGQNTLHQFSCSKSVTSWRGQKSYDNRQINHT